MDDLDALIARLEKATGPDRELDCRIHILLHDPQVMTDGGGYGPKAKAPTYDKASNVFKDWPSDWEGVARTIDAPRYTASIDAAMQLVPEGYYLAEFGDCLTHWKARLAPREAHPTIPRGHMNHYCGFNDGMKPKTGPIALTIAALKARKQSNG